MDRVQESAKSHKTDELQPFQMLLNTQRLRKSICKLIISGTADHSELAVAVLLAGVVIAHIDVL